MDSNKITGYLFLLLSGIVGIIFLSSVFMIGEQTQYINRLAVMNKKKDIEYFINFKTMPDSQVQFSKYLSIYPNLIYQNPKKGVFFFNTRNKVLKTKVENVIKKIQSTNIDIEVFSNSKRTLQAWRTKETNNDFHNKVHLIDSPYICFTNKCYDSFVGFQLSIKKEVSEKNWAHEEHKEEKNDA